MEGTRTEDTDKTDVTDPLAAAASIEEEETNVIIVAVVVLVVAEGMNLTVDVGKDNIEKKPLAERGFLLKEGYMGFLLKMYEIIQIYCLLFDSNYK